jgi:F0F1-type ATP synthase epsilon subunit
MAKDIELKIYMPEKKVFDKKVFRAVLPYDNKTITVLKDRAPTLLSLDMGIIQILDETYNTTEEWFIADGMADIKNNTCTILTESCFDKNELSLEKAKELNENFSNPFYKWLIEFYEKQEALKKLQKTSKI